MKNRTAFSWGPMTLPELDAVAEKLRRDALATRSVGGITLSVEVTGGHLVTIRAQARKSGFTRVSYKLYFGDRISYADLVKLVKDKS